jgi:hypothetical protein
MKSTIARTTPGLLLGALLLAAGACASSNENVETTRVTEAEAQAQARDAHMAQRRAAMQQICPLAVDGAEVDAENTTGGVALEFETDDDELVEELRQRVRRMAEMHERHQTAMSTGAMQPGEVQPVEPGATTGPPQPGMGRGMGPMMRMHQDITVPTTTRVVDVEDGARLVFEPLDLNRLDELRRQVEAHAEKMEEKGECPMTASGPTFE